MKSTAIKVIKVKINIDFLLLSNYSDYKPHIKTKTYKNQFTKENHETNSNNHLVDHIVWPSGL